METLEQMALRIGAEIDDGTGEQMFTDTDNWLIEFSRRLVAELAKQEPVTWLSRCFENGDVAADYKNSPATEFWSASFPVYLHPIPTPEDVRDAEPSEDWFNCLIDDIDAIDCRYRGDPSYDHDAYWMRNEIIRMLKNRRDAAMTAAQEGK